MKKQKFAKIQEVLTEMAESGGAAGGNCLIFRHGEECCYYEAGYADLEKRIPIKRDTIFRLYSMTKPMTAVGAMLLVQDGKLDLLAPVSRFLPSFGNPQVSENGKLRPALREIQVRDLLNMTSGMQLQRRCQPDGGRDHQPDRGDQVPDGWRESAEYREIAERLGKIPLAFDPGTTFRYGMSADILGAVIEVVSGKRFGEFLKERIFEPLAWWIRDFLCRRRSRAVWLRPTSSRKTGFTFTPAAIWEFRAGWNVNRPMKPGEPGW